MICQRKLGQFTGTQTGAACDAWFVPGRAEDYPGCGHSNLIHQEDGPCLGCILSETVRAYSTAISALTGVLNPVLSVLGKHAGLILDSIREQP